MSVKPITCSVSEEFVARFDGFIDCEIKSINMPTPTSCEITCNAQDTQRGFDWIGLKLTCSEISDAKLLDNSELSYLDMSDGISILYEDNNVILSVGKYKSFSNAKDAKVYIVANSIKYKETMFH
ncbi:MAG: hypothetical protein U9N42_08625 [Campylobacterota bacterium]|nr:hypothetical protein [Campylobacterota bacterium]